MLILTKVCNLNRNDQRCALLPVNNKKRSLSHNVSQNDTRQDISINEAILLSFISSLTAYFIELALSILGLIDECFRHNGYQIL